MHLHSSYTSFKSLASINGYKQQLPARSHSLFEKAITIFQPSAKVLMQANNLFNLYCQQNKSEIEQQILPLLSEISVFVAESSQELRDLRGKKIPGIGLPLNRLIGNSQSIKQTLEELTKFINNTPIYIQQQYKRQIEQYLAKTELTFKIMHNFEYYIKQLQFTIVQSAQTSKYRDTFIELAWMLYIDCRDNFIRNLEKYPPFQSNVCLLASVLYFMIRYSMDYIYPRALKNERQSDKRALIAKILQLLLDLFNIQNIELYKKIAEKFDQYIEIQIHSQTLRIVASDTDFFCPSIINLNYKQLQNRYQKNLQPKDVDYRLFRKQKSLSPIHKEVLVNNRLGRKNLTQPKNATRVFKSHRYLNYEQTEGDKQEILSRENSKSSNNPENPSKNKILNKFNLNCANRGSLTNGEGINTQIYRYIKSITNKRRQQRHSKKSQATLKIIQNYLQKYKLPFQYSPVIKKHSSEISESVYQVYLYFCNKIQYSLDKSSPYSNNESISSQINYNLIALCLVIVLSMYSQMASSNQQAIELEIPIFNIVAYVCNPSPLQLWFLIQQFFKNRPIFLGQFAKSQSRNRGKYSASVFDQIAELAANYEKSYQILYFSQKLFEYCEKFLQKITSQLQVSAEHSTYAYNCMKFILSANGNILQNRHLDQILMCTLYISGKTLASPILFIHIKQAYENLSKNLPSCEDLYSSEAYYSGEHFKSEQIFNNVVQDEHGSGDIIYFYNKYFIESVKPFVPYMANPSLCLLHPLFQRKIAQNSQQFPQYESPHQNKQQHMLTLMQTQKPKAPPTRYNHNALKLEAKNKANQKQNDRIGILIKSQRNETRVRIRPNNNYIENELCETQKIKSSDAKLQRDHQKQYQLVPQPHQQEYSDYSQNQLEDLSVDLGQNY